MNRKSLREQIFKLLFRTEFNDPAEMEEQVQFFFDSGDMTVTDKDREYIARKCSRVVEKIDEIDRVLDEKLEGWTVNRLPKVELAILRLGTYEILYDESVPTGVAINEAVELGKKFGEDGSGSFINGVLAGVSGKENKKKAESDGKPGAGGKHSSGGSMTERKGETYITRRI
jgi:N utilization substance protein B